MALSLVFADTLLPNTTPQSVHEIRFKRPVHLRAFRVVAEGERPHTEIRFEGQTPPTQVALQMFGCEHGAATLCASMLGEPHLRQDLSTPSQLHMLNDEAATLRCNYLVLRCMRSLGGCCP